MASGCCTERDDLWVSWEEDGEAILNFSDRFLDELGWKCGDDLEMEVDGDCLIIRKLEND